MFGVNRVVVVEEETHPQKKNASNFERFFADERR